MAASSELRHQVEMQFRAEIDAIFMKLVKKLDEIDDKRDRILKKYRELTKDEYKIEKMDEKEIIKKEIGRLTQRLTAAYKDLLEVQKARQVLWQEALSGITTLVANFDLNFYHKMAKWGEDCEEFDYTDKLMRSSMVIAKYMVQCENRTCIDLQVNPLKIRLAENLDKDGILTMLEHFKSMVADHEKFEWDPGQCGCCMELSFKRERGSSASGTSPIKHKKGCKYYKGA